MRFLLLSSVRLALVSLLLAATLPRVDSRVLAQPTFTTAIDLVHLPVTVLDGNGRFVSDLGRDDFMILEDGKPQPLQVFTARSIPLSLGILLDASESMKGRRFVDAMAALNLLVQEALAPDDEAFVMTFGQRPKMLIPWTPKSNMEAIAFDAEVGGSTPMFETLTLAEGNLPAARHVRRALLIITDGNATDDPDSYRTGPTGADFERSPLSRSSRVQLPLGMRDDWPLQAREALRRSEALLYAVGIDSPPEVKDEFDARPLNKAVLTRLTKDTGGYTEVVKSSADLVTAIRRLTDELMHQYLLGYASSRAHDGTYHKVQVEVRRSGCRVRSRTGFQAGGGQ